MNNKNLYDAKESRFSISDNIDYDNCMNFYLSEDNLIEYLDNKKKEGTITQEEIEFWEGAIELDLVKDICRTAIVESHKEDRAKDPIKIKLARETLDILDNDGKASKEADTRKLFSVFYKIGCALKEIIMQKSKDKTKSIEDILENLFDNTSYQMGSNIQENEQALYDKMKNFSQKIKQTIGISKMGNSQKECSDFYQLLFNCRAAKVIREHEEKEMVRYVEAYSIKKAYNRITLEDINTAEKILRETIIDKVPQVNKEKNSHDI